MTGDVLESISKMLELRHYNPAPEGTQGDTPKTRVSPEKPSVSAAGDTGGHRRHTKQEIYIGEGSEQEKKEEEREEEASRVESLSQNSVPCVPPPLRGAETLAKSGDTCVPRCVPCVPNREECDWHLAHGERVPRDLCAGCRRPIMPGQATLDLADDNRVHFPHGVDGYDCLIRHGERWSRVAHDAVVGGPGRCRIAGTATAREKQELLAQARHAAVQQRAIEDSVTQLLARAFGATQASHLPYEALRQYADTAVIGEGDFARAIKRLVEKERVERYDDGTGHPTYGLPATVHQLRQPMSQLPSEQRLESKAAIRGPNDHDLQGGQLRFLISTILGEGEGAGPDGRAAEH